MSVVEIAKQYFKIFSKKDLNGLLEMFSKDIKLIDWEIKAQGLEQVIETIRNIFESVESIKINPYAIYNDDKAVIAELEIIINSKQEILQVVDIIEFDNEFKISAIRAYKR